MAKLVSSSDKNREVFAYHYGCGYKSDTLYKLLLERTVLTSEELIGFMDAYLADGKFASFAECWAVHKNHFSGISKAIRTIIHRSPSHPGFFVDPNYFSQDEIDEKIKYFTHILEELMRERSADPSS